MKRILVLGAVLLLSVFGVVACGDDDESQATAEENLCASLEGFSAALANVQGVQLLNPDANQATRPVRGARATWSGVQAAAQDVQEADVNALNSAVDDLESAAQDLPSGSRPAQIRQALQPQLTAVYTAFNEMYDGLECSTRELLSRLGCSRLTAQQIVRRRVWTPRRHAGFGQAGARIRTGDLPLTRRPVADNLPQHEPACSSIGRMSPDVRRKSGRAHGADRREAGSRTGVVPAPSSSAGAAAGATAVLLLLLPAARRTATSREVCSSACRAASWRKSSAPAA